MGFGILNINPNSKYLFFLQSSASKLQSKLKNLTESPASQRSVLLPAGVLFAESVQTELDALRPALTGQRFGCRERLGKDGWRWRKLSERKWADGSTSNWIIAYSDKVSACLQMDYTELTSTWLISWSAHRNIMTSAHRCYVKQCLENRFQDFLKYW